MPRSTTPIKPLSSRTIHLKRTLAILGLDNAYKALDLMIDEMNAENGFARHNGAHYYYHLVDVTQLLINFGIKDENTLIAALLHDYIEDVEGITKKLVANQFNNEVAEIVDVLSKDKSINYHENDEAMTEYLNAILCNPKACLVKTADRINNFQTLRNASLSHREKQLKNTLTYFIPFFKACRNQYVEHESFYFQAKTMIEPIAFEVERYINDINEKENEIKRLKEQLAKQRSEKGKTLSKQTVDYLNTPNF